MWRGNSNFIFAQKLFSSLTLQTEIFLNPTPYPKLRLVAVANLNSIKKNGFKG